MTTLTVEVYCDDPTRPPAGAPVLVQVRDTSLQDAAAVVLARARGTVGAGRDDAIARVELEADWSAPSPEVWVHVDADGDGRVSTGDYLTTQSHPVPRGAGPSTVRVRVRRV